MWNFDLYISRYFQPLITALIIAIISICYPAYAYEPPRSALMIDIDKNKITFEENANEIRHPASLTKMMTLYLVFEAIEADLIDLDTPVVGSRHSADRPPSRLGLVKDASIPLDLAIDALVVRSANDVAAAIGELLAGTESEFAELMTKKARQLGMHKTVYKNASGLPNKEQITTAHDQAILGLALKEHFPTYFPRFSVPEVSYKDRTWNTHNNLLKKVPTVTGIKTGFINASGFNVVTYDDHPDGAKLVVVMGGRSAKERDQIVIDILDGKTPAYQNEANPEFVVKDIKGPTVPVKIPAFIDRVVVASTTSSKPVKPIAAPLPNAETTIVPPVETASIAPQNVTSETPVEIKRYAIQVGVLPSVDAARTRLEQARPALTHKSDTLRQFTLPLKTSNGTHYRARIVGFASMQAAFDACDVMKSNEIECMALVQK